MVVVISVQRQEIVDYSNGKLQSGADDITKGQRQVLDAEGDQAQFNAKKRAQKDSLANIHVSIGSSSSKSVTHSEMESYAGGQLASKGKIKLVATSNKAANGNITAIGQTIDAKSVDMIADNTLTLDAGTNRSIKTEKYDSKGWSVGANISVNGIGMLGFDASYNQGMQRGNTEKTTHTGTNINAESVTISSGKDTNVIGSTVKANRIDATIGGDLHVKSLQDTERYVGESKSAGASISTNATKLSNISGSFSKGKMESDYASVTQQAGFFAGDDGFNIQTNGTTSLEGAVLDSTATADKNSLQTGSLELKDIQNKAEYSSTNRGISYNHVAGFKKLSKEGQDAVYNTLGVLPKLLPDSRERAESTTTSAISNGRIDIKDGKIDIQTISRNTQDSLHKLDVIFDKKKVEERQELARLFAKDAFEQLHYWEPKTDKDKAAKAIAHGIVAEISARMAGNPAGSGFYAGATEAQYSTKYNNGFALPLTATSLSRLLVGVRTVPNNGSIVGAMPSEGETISTSTSRSISDQSTPMDDVISSGPNPGNSSRLNPPVVIESEKAWFPIMPPKVNNKGKVDSVR